MRRSPRSGLALVEVVLVAGFVAAGAASYAVPRYLHEAALRVELDAVGPHVISAERFLQLWGQRLRRPIFMDQQLAGTTIRFVACDQPVPWEIAKKILDFYDVVLDEKEVNGHPIMYAHSRRNCTGRLGPPPRERVVTAVVTVKNGAGNDIFATVRGGLITRDVTRTGNMLYVRGPEVIIIVDYASTVNYYLEVIRALDAQMPGQITRVVHVQFVPAAEVARALRARFAPPLRANAEDHTNALFVSANKDQLSAIEDTISALDVKPRARLGARALMR